MQVAFDAWAVSLQPINSPRFRHRKLANVAEAQELLTVRGRNLQNGPPSYYS